MGTDLTGGTVSQRDLARARAIGGLGLSPGDEAQGDARVSITAVNEAVAEVMRGDDPHRLVDQSLAATIGGAIRPSVERMIARKVGSGSELLGLSAFRTAVSQYLNSPTSSQLDAETRRVMLHRLETANRTGSEFAALIGSGVRLAALGALSGETAREVARAEGRRSSAEFAQAFNGGPYAANTLSNDMRGYVDPAHGITAAHVAGVGNYLHGLGISAQQYTGYFVGSSDAIRNAIRDHIAKGAKITDEQVKNPSDVKAIIGAIKAGRMKPEDAPPSVQQIIKDMEKKGVNSNDPKAVEKFFEQNPRALQDVKRANEASATKAVGHTDAEIKAARDAATTGANQSAPSPPPSTPSQQPQKPDPAAKPVAAAKPRELKI